MPNLDISTPSQDQLAAMFDPLVEAVQEVAADAWLTIKERAMLDNEDANGQQMPPKVPKPKKNPHNFPKIPLVQDTDPDLMNNDRFTVEHTDDGAVLIYHPPEHLAYLLDKPQVEGGGGRHWIGRDGTLNPNAKADIEQAIANRIAKKMNL